MNLIQPNKPIMSRNLADFMTPGVVVEVDPMEAEALGAFEETALSVEDAWESQVDLEGGSHE